MHLPVATGVALAVVIGALAAVSNRFVRARLGFAVAVLVVALGFDLALARSLGDPALIGGLGRLLLVAGVLVATVSLLFNPWRRHGVSERVPAIVQDIVVIALFAVAATMLLDEKVLTTSAVGAVVVGFALQDTLGNLFAGLAIQVEKPFRVGHWVRIGEFEGRVQDVTWRATKLLTKQGQFVIVPNSVMSKDPILNYSEPTVPTRIEVSIGASYDVAPNVVRQALAEAIDNAPLVLRAPAPEVIFDAFGASSLDFKVYFWIADFGRDYVARDQVRSNIWYTFRRHGIEIPYPIQIEYSREEQSPRSTERLRALADRLGAIDLFSGFDDVERARLAELCSEQLFGARERIVRQGDDGRSMFVVLSGRVRVTIDPSGQEVAVISSGGFFGEMSMLTGDPRTATVTAIDDAVLLEIDADRFRELAVRRSDLVEQVSAAVSSRRQGLEEARAAAESTRPGASPPQSLLARIKTFLRL